MTYIEMQNQRQQSQAELVAIRHDIDELDFYHKAYSTAIGNINSGLETDFERFNQLINTINMLADFGTDSSIVEQELCTLAEKILKNFDTKDQIEGTRYHNEEMALGLTDDLEEQTEWIQKQDEAISLVETSQQNGSNVTIFPKSEVSTEPDILLGVTLEPGKLLIMKTPSSHSNKRLQ